MLTAITDRRLQALPLKRAEGLAAEPEKQGKPLSGDLAGYRSIRAVGQRYRILYRIEQQSVIVVVVALGIRQEDSQRDVYALAQRLARLGLLGAPKGER